MCKACTEGVHCVPPFHPPTPRCVDGLMLYIKVSEKSKISSKHHGHLRSVLQLPHITTYIIPFILITMENGICPRSGTFPFACITSFLLMFIGLYPRVGNPNTYWTIIWSNQTIGGGIDIPLPFFWIVTLNLGLRTADPSSSAEYPSNTPNTWHANGTKGGFSPLGKGN